MFYYKIVYRFVDMSMVIKKYKNRVNKIYMF